MSITSGQILELIRAKHLDDVFVSECKNGPTYNNPNNLRLDAWAMKKCWSPIRTVGYEIKVSRKDWLSDKKWTRYLPLAHSFYVVCPKNMIRPEEMPEGVGLLYVAASEGKLYTKIRAKRKEIEVSRELLMYVLFHRARIVAPARLDWTETKGAIAEMEAR